MRSQDTTDVRPVTLPAWMVKEIALDLNDRQHLRSVLDLTNLELVRYKSLTQNLESTLQKKDLQLQLLRKTKNMLDTRLKAERAKNPENPIFPWLLRMISAFGIGYFLGNL